MTNSNGNSRKRSSGEEIIFKEKIDEEVNMNENMSLQTENTQVLSRIKEKIPPRYIVMKLQNSKDKEKILKTRGKAQITYRETIITLIAIKLSATTKAESLKISIKC